MGHLSILSRLMLIVMVCLNFWVEYGKVLQCFVKIYLTMMFYTFFLTSCNPAPWDGLCRFFFFLLCSLFICLLLWAFQIVNLFSELIFLLICYITEEKFHNCMIHKQEEEWTEEDWSIIIGGWTTKQEEKENEENVLGRKNSWNFCWEVPLSRLGWWYLLEEKLLVVYRSILTELAVTSLLQLERWYYCLFLVSYVCWVLANSMIKSSCCLHKATEVQNADLCIMV